MLSLGRQKKADSVVGLDIAAGSVAAAEVVVNGTARVAGSAIGPLDPGAFNEGEVRDADRLTASLKSFFAEHRLPKRVRLGVGNQQVVVRMVRLPVIEDPKEMESAVRFQAQEQIPMPLEQAVLEYQVVGGVPAEEGGSPQVDVVLVAARREMIDAFLGPLRRADLEPIGIDLAAFGMIRALADLEPGPRAGTGEAASGGDAPSPAPGVVLYCSVGDVTNLAVARGRACLFSRVSNAGLEAISTRLAAACALSPEHAEQWLTHVGLETPVEQIEGDPQIVAEARTALERGVTSLIDELRLSLDYYSTQEGALPVERIVLAGPGSAIQGLPARMEVALGQPIATARPPALAGFGDGVAARLTLPFGLALGD